MSQRTRGPWRVGTVRNGGPMRCVVSDHPAPGIGGSDDVAYYGGHMICESVSIVNAQFIVDMENAVTARADGGVAFYDRVAAREAADAIAQLTAERDELRRQVETMAKADAAAHKRGAIIETAIDGALLTLGIAPSVEAAGRVADMLREARQRAEAVS